MANMIASTYEIVKEIGSGGGGVVYLGRHLRLGKLVVLKADKRTLSAKPEALRREVDALKNLSHTYIPQVYDFVEQEGAVYTVMDYIEGESLDKPLKREERFPQAQVIGWACQLLEALCYLHSRLPHGILHGDIKPANIMLTPQGDIRLIDFNIALALGEEGAVRVGFSQGYASPEHYGVDYSEINATQGVSEDVNTLLPTDPAATELGSVSGSGHTSGHRTIYLDVRSDIYSLGASLYHLLTGRRPEQNAKAVQPIAAEDGISPAVAAIIQKAMSPAPEQRYQTAEEMLYAFEHLHESDPRMKRCRRRETLTACVLAAMFLTGGLFTFLGLQQKEQIQERGRLAAERMEQAFTAVTESENAYRRGDIPEAIQCAVNGLDLDSPYRAQAQKALTDALGVYELSDSFHSWKTLELPSEPLKLALSPSGNRLAAVYAFQADIFDLAAGKKLAELPLEPSALSDIMFLDDNRLLYAGEGAVTACRLTDSSILWTGNAATALALSADGARAAAINRDEGQAYVYDVNSGALLQTVSFQGRNQWTVANDVFADTKDNLFALDASGRYMAVSFSDGSLSVFDLEGGDELELLASSANAHFEGGFFGPYFAFSAWDGQESVFAVVDIVNMVQTGGFASKTPFLLQVDETGICIASDNLLVKIDPETGEQSELAYLDKDITAFQVRDSYTITATGDQTAAIFDGGARKIEEIDCETSCDFLQISNGCAVTGSRNSTALRLLKRENHPESELLSYDPAYYHDEARLSASGNTIMLFSYTGFRLYSREGKLLTEVPLPDAEQVYDQQYRREPDGSCCLEVIYNSGLRRVYSAQDGTLLREQQGKVPSNTLEEEFLTDRLRIVSAAHQTPVVYDRESGAQIQTLEEEAYLTYVTQAGEYIITEYISAQGERYGLLLDEQLEELAYLPDLCDVVEGNLIFDYPSGVLRQSPIYSRQELLEMGRLTIDGFPQE